MNDGNPYQYEGADEPVAAQGFARDDAWSWEEEGSIRLPPGMPRGWWAHVPFLGVLLLLQGLAELLYGLFLAAVTLSIPGAWQQENQDGTVFSVTTPWSTVALIYGGMTLWLLAAGGLKVFAGIGIRHYRNRAWGLAALSCGFLAFLGGCLCFPTSLLVSIYGLFVLLDRSAQVAFQLGEAGYSDGQIRQAFQGHERPGPLPP